MSEFYDKVRSEAQAVLLELLDVAGLKPGNILVVGCSTSEVAGGTIGKNCSAEAAQAIYDAAAPILQERGIYLAAQCCEHLNRALVVERACAEKYGLDEVCVKPQPHAGGSWATKVYGEAEDPVMVESIRAHAGIDIGLTLIGMHLRPVAVPVRTVTRKIGSAVVVTARTRPKLIGGERAKYPD
ncbi:MAG: TIGR01440 family protein [Clostridia bacterium]|nr:TIGR01440 family protein [Clostridia bacterium]